MLFFFGNLIGEFYLLLIDVSLPVNQSSTGEIRIWESIILTSPFSGGWLGFFPWYGNFPMPPKNIGTFHEPWSWILFTSTFTDNPAFLDTVVWVVLLGTILSGILFLSPLFLGVIRRSFLPSMFFFFTGMMVTMKGLFSCFAQAFQLEFASDSITYGIYTVNESNFVNVTDLVMSFLLPLFFIILGFFVFFALLGHKVWSYHYPDKHFSYNWFLLFITFIFWGSFAMLII